MIRSMAGGERGSAQAAPVRRPPAVRSFTGGGRATAGNPYVSGNSVGGTTAFVGREDVVRAVVDALSQQSTQGIVLHGQRRIGKTSILQHLLTALPERTGHRPVYFDLQDKAAEPLASVLRELSLDIAAALGEPAPKPGGDVETWFRDEWLPAILAGLAPDTSLVLLFDEFDVLADVQAKQAASALFPYLRRLLENNLPRLRVVFVIGRNIDDLANVAHSLFKGIPSYQVSLLAREDAERLIRLSEGNGTLRWSDEAVAKAWGLTHGHPLLLQSLCSNAWVRAHGGQGQPASPVTAAEVDAAAELTLGSTRSAFEWLWKGLPPGKRVVAAALAQAGPEAISEEALHKVLNENGVRVIIRELRDAPRMMIEWDLLEEPARGQYRFRVELLRRLIAQYKPLASAQEDLDKIEPAAEALYKAGAALFDNGSLDSAKARLEEALGINPSHGRASELLADILISRKAWAEARVVLERLYESQPALGRARLVQVLLAQAEASRVGVEKIALYERILTIDKTAATAAEGLRGIWKARGDRARAAGNLEGAREAYASGGLEDLARDVAGELAELVAINEMYAQAIAPGTDPARAKALLANVVGRRLEFKDALERLYAMHAGIEIQELRRRLAAPTPEPDPDPPSSGQPWDSTRETLRTYGPIARYMATAQIGLVVLIMLCGMLSSVPAMGNVLIGAIIVGFMSIVASTVPVYRVARALFGVFPGVMIMLAAFGGGIFCLGIPTMLYLAREAKRRAVPPERTLA
jgi:tetratricopeptide (TPR) repeat protein